MGEPLKQAARCLNKLRPKYRHQMSDISQDKLFKINYWKRNAHFCLVRFSIQRCVDQRLAVPNVICNVAQTLKIQLSQIETNENEKKYDEEDEEDQNKKLLQLDEY